MTPPAPSPSHRRPLAGIGPDLRNLGWGAPLRAVYEAAKRLGGHRVVFGHLVPPRRERTGTSPLTLHPVPPPVRERTLEAAAAIATGTVTLFGRPITVGNPPHWHALLHTDGTWPRKPWWQIDIRSPSRPGDVKWVWELGRHHHLVLLARAVKLAPDDHRWATALSDQLASWIEANPPETGVHWYSNLEIALRAVAWLEILALAGDHLPGDLPTRMWGHLHHAARHLVADLPYTYSTMRNNHLLGDALGLVALGKAFGGHTGRRWARLGDRILRAQLHRQMRPDGSMIEDAIGYHRFVLEMLIMRILLGDPPDEVRVAAVAAAGFMARLGCLTGPVPRYGDGDEGRVLTVAGNPTDLAGTVRLAFAVAGDGAPPTWREDHDEVAWYAPEGAPLPPPAVETAGHHLGGGLARAVAGTFTVWLKAGTGPSHGHADLTSVAIAQGDAWVVADPGTGTYNGPAAVRTALRSSAAHDVLRLDGVDQLVPHRTFRWVHRARGVAGEPVRAGDAVVMWALHDAYRRLTPPRRLVRVVAVTPETVAVIDWPDGGPVTAELALPLPPQVTWDPATGLLRGAGPPLHLAGQDRNGPTPPQPASSLWSAAYGTWRPVTVPTVVTDGTGPRLWYLTRTPQEPPIRVGDDVAVGSLRITVGFTPDAATLAVGDGTTTTRRRLPA